MSGSNQPTMGAMITRLIWGGDPDLPNSVSGLTKRDIQRIQKTWTMIFDNASFYGLEMFLRLFCKCPETRGYFRFIKDLSDEQIAKSYQFKAHLQNVMGSLNSAIRNLNEPEVIIALMHKLGDFHQMKHLEKKHFEDFKEVVIEILTKDLKFSEKNLCSWGKFIDFINKHIYERLHVNKI